MFIVVISYHSGDLSREDLCARFRVEQLTMRVDIRAARRALLLEPDRPLDARVTEDVSTGRRARLLDRIQANGAASFRLKFSGRTIDRTVNAARRDARHVAAWRLQRALGRWARSGGGLRAEQSISAKLYIGASRAPVVEILV